MNDALNRPVSLTAPDASEVRPGYNEAGLLEQVDVRIRGAEAWTSFVDDIDYDAKGQREKIVYGNGTATTYTYDPQTFRLKRLRTVRDSDSAVLQNLSYTYDPVGNITEIRDSAQQTVFYNNDVVSPSTQYVYDALYRLIEASGREHAGGAGDVQRDQNDLPLMNLPHENDSAAVRNYTELYAYDEVGNILSMIHQAGMAGSWTRRYEVAEDSNRLLSTSLPGDGETGPYSATYSYDEHGNMTAMPHLSSVGWDYRDQMLSSDLGGGGVVYYTYDAGGQRVRKVWEHSGLVEERIYLGGYEVYRKRDAGGLLLERQTLHGMDGEKRIALVETTTVDTAAGGSFEVSTVVRYQLGNHLGSAVLEVDGEGAVISYEEYHPYGTSAYRSGTGAAEVSLKRYRYTGKERDEETGLYYHGARYYACWLGRWTAADPAGMVDGPSLYSYCTNNPIIFADPDGADSKSIHIDTRLEAIVGRALGISTQMHQYRSQVAVDGAAADSNAASKELWNTLIKPQLESGKGITAPPDDWKRELGQKYAVMSEAERKDFYDQEWEIWRGPDVSRKPPRGWDALAARVSRYALDEVHNEGVVQGYTLVDGAALARGVTTALARKVAFHIEGELASGGFWSGSYNVGKAGGTQWGAETVGFDTAARGGAASAKGSLQPIAVGLSKSPNHSKGLLGRFADKVGATTYWDQYPIPASSNKEIIERMIEQFKQRPIAVNLSGMEQMLGEPHAGLSSIFRESSKTVTEAEISHVIANPEFFDKASFFLNGKKLRLDRARIVGTGN
ncbi:MAG: RHS repeat-associated core domain-containing protein [Byssovorax sp.]